ncbi:thioredoxin-2 [Adelges cooleyi]|uniref:thioredoxin-2 n=1 Tax=Adelges cooleyi TaxID=133065 RepID=UPI00217FBBF5|nr:thioredoxin-2 [Adelges cooleyi]
MVYLVTDAADLAAKLTDAKGKLVIIDFFAKWCGPCKLIAPYIEELANEFPDVVMLKVDVDECEEASLEYNIQSMPTFVFVKSKAEVDRFSGANRDKLKETLVKNK